MAAPASTGKLCTSLDQMAIGDYIKCVYESPIANTAGYFTQLGALSPKLKITKIEKNGENDPNPIITETEEAYGELPTIPGTTASGFFYLLKVDDGLLVADRMIQTQISWQAINEKNYIYGAAINASNSALEKIITITTEERATQDGDVAGTVNLTPVHDNDQKYFETGTKVTTITEQKEAVVNEETGTSSEVVVSRTTKIVTTVNRINYAVEKKDNQTSISSKDDRVLVRILSKEESNKYIKNSSLDGSIEANDGDNVWHFESLIIYSQSDFYYSNICDKYGGTYGGPFYFYVEKQQDNTTNGYKFLSHGVTSFNFAYAGWLNFDTMLANDKTSTQAFNIHGGFMDSRRLIGNPSFRPAMSFVDNKKSKNLFY